MEYNEMSNAELAVEKIKLENEYESTKSKVNKLLEHLEELEKEYSKVEAESNRRKSR